MNIIKSGPVLPVTIKTACSLVVTTNLSIVPSVLTGDTVMAPSIQVFLQAALFCCVVTTSMGGITDWQKEFSQLENKVNVQQEEIKSLHLIIVQLEKRLEQLEMKGEFGEFKLVRIILLLTIEFHMGVLYCIYDHLSKLIGSKKVHVKIY